MDDGPLKCPDCDERFLASHLLRSHLKTVHPKPPEVLNQADYGRHWPPGTTYIGRGSPYGNPYIVGRHGERGECIALFIAEKEKDPAFIALVKRYLKGRHLGCHCKPRPCHGDWLHRVANDDDFLPVEPDGQNGWRFVLTDASSSFTAVADD